MKCEKCNKDMIEYCMCFWCEHCGNLDEKHIKMSNMEFRFRIKIIDELQKQFNLSRKQAWEELIQSAFDELFSLDKQLVYHYYPAYWAKWVYGQGRCES